MRNTKFGSPPPKPRSKLTTIILDPVGMMTDMAPHLLPPGANPGHNVAPGNLDGTISPATNFIVQDGALVPRPKISSHTSNANPLGTLVTGGTEIESSVGTQYNLISGTTRMAYYSNGSYSPLSYVSSAGRSTPPSLTTADRMDFCQIYEATNDEMLGLASATSSYQTLFCWKSGATIFSSLTQSPSARWVAAFDNFVVAGNIRDSSGSKYVQRVQWSDRGNPFVWTPASGNLAGNQDLLDAKGSIQRIIAQEQRLIIFFDHEIWVGQRDNFPNTFRFTPLDRSVGTRFGKTCAVTPKGIMFLTDDWMIYLLPKEGGPAVPVGQRIQARLRSMNTVVPTIPTNAWAVYDEYTSSYQLFITNWLARDTMTHPFPLTDLPQDAFFVNVNNGSLTEQTWRRTPGSTVTGVHRHFSCGWAGTVVPSTTNFATWSSVSGVHTWASNPYSSWVAADSRSSTKYRTTFMGTSDGTVYLQDTRATADEGGSVPAIWVSPPLFTDSPDRLKCVNAVRVDYETSYANIAINMQFGQPYKGDGSPAFPGSGTSVSLPVTAGHPTITAVAHVYASSRYPSLVVTTTDHQLRLLRFWVSARMSGRGGPG